jgi:UDP-glucose 4-epimerase
MINILVIGANGLLGQEIVRNLSKENKVYALVRESYPIDFENHKNIKIFKIDLSKPNKINLPKDIKVIYYLAQSNHYRDFPKEGKDMLWLNVISPIEIISWALKNNVKKFVFASSGGVYKNPDYPVKEIFNIDISNKNGFYLDTKLCSEILLKNYAVFFETFIIARPFFIYGKNQKKQMLIPRLIDSIMNNNEIFLASEEGIKINPINVMDAAKAFENMIRLKGEHIFNIAGDEIVSITSIVNLIASKLDKKVDFVINKSDQNDLVADNSKMKDLLHKPQVSLNKGLNEMLF